MSRNQSGARDRDPAGAPGRNGRIDILGVGIDRVTLAEAVRRCVDFIASGRPHLVVTPNAEMIQAAARDPELAQIIAQADLAVPDGAGVVLAGRLLGTPLPERVAGVDLADGVLRAAPPGARVFLLGAAPDSVAAAARRLPELYPAVAVAGCRDGYWPHFDPAADAEVIAAVRAAAPAILLAGLGVPKQEKWLSRYLGDLGVPLCIGIGGGIDLWAGRSPRAPAWMRRANLEWAYRIVKFGRYGRSLPPLAAFAWRAVRRRLGMR